MEPMSEQDITIMKVKTATGGNSRLYYYQGNFFHPLDMLSKDWKSRVKFKITQFKKENADLVKKDRAHPDYKSGLGLFDEQVAEWSVK